VYSGIRSLPYREGHLYTPHPPAHAHFTERGVCICPLLPVRYSTHAHSVPHRKGRLCPSLPVPYAAHDHCVPLYPTAGRGSLSHLLAVTNRPRGPCLCRSALQLIPIGRTPPGEIVRLCIPWGLAWEDGNAYTPPYKADMKTASMDGNGVRGRVHV
jgi:hypothetical protein